MHIDVTKVRGWLNRRDDLEFWDRARDACGVYLNRPDNAIVLAVDEKLAGGPRQQTKDPASVSGRRKRAAVQMALRQRPVVA